VQQLAAQSTSQVVRQCTLQNPPDIISYFNIMLLPHPHQLLHTHIPQLSDAILYRCYETVCGVCGEITPDRTQSVERIEIAQE